MKDKVEKKEAVRSQGRPQKEPDWSKLDGLLAMDASKGLCQDILDVSDMTLDRHIKKKYNLTFSEYKEKKLERTAIKLKQVMIRKAEAGDQRALEFVLKNISNWSDNPEQKLDMSQNTLEFV
jgi:hypothetical protein